MAKMLRQRCRRREPKFYIRFGAPKFTDIRYTLRVCVVDDWTFRFDWSLIS